MNTISNIILFIFLFFLGCASNFYVIPEGRSLASSHEIIAVLPPNIFSGESEKRKSEILEFDYNSESYLFQEEIYIAILERNIKEKSNIKVQNIEKTNTILNGNKKDPSQVNINSLCDLLDVDALLTSKFEIEPQDPMFWRVFFMLLEGEYIHDERDVEISLTIKDCSEESIIWNYTDIGYGVSPSRVVRSIIKRATKKIPYFIEYN